jgi:hypothetical protein
VQSLLLIELRADYRLMAQGDGKENEPEQGASRS